MKSGWLGDVLYSVRMLVRRPSFTLLAVATLALGIGLNTAIFSILDAVVLQSLAVPHGEQMVTISQDVRAASGRIHRNVHNDASFVSYSEYRRYAQDNSVFSGLAAYSPFVEASAGRQHPQQMLGTLVSCNYFEVLEVRPQLGRGLADSDCNGKTPGAVMVLSDRLWRNAFGADPSVIGTTVSVNRTPLVVIGVAPVGFDGTMAIASAFWAPIEVQHAVERGSDRLSDDYMSWLGMMGRLKPGESVRSATADLGVIASRFNGLQPGRITTVQVNPATMLDSPEMRTPILLVGAGALFAVGLVLLLACANVANLALAYATGRRKEMAVRLALGASRGRLIRQLLTESLLLSLCGGAIGALVSLWSAEAAFQYAMRHLPVGPAVLHLNVRPDARFLVYALLISVVTGALSGLAPALRASRGDLTLAMKDEGGEAQTRQLGGGWLRQWLVGVQVAFCMILLLATGLLLRGFERGQTIDPGFATKNIDALSFDLKTAGYTDAEAATFQQRLRDNLSAIPGVDGIAQMSSIPLADQHVVSNFSTPGTNRDFDLEFSYVSENALPMLGVSIVRGRGLTRKEVESGDAVAIVSQSAAKIGWPDGDALGKRLHGEGKDWTVVGIAGEAKVGSLTRQRPYLYLASGTANPTSLKALVHAAAMNAGTETAIRAAATGVDPDVPMEVAALAQNLDSWRAPAKVVLGVSEVLSALALALASLGIYGTVSYGVSRRIREIGIRMVLGATNNEVTGLMVRQAMLPVAVGAIVGAIGCACMSWALSSLLFGVSPLDPVSFAGVLAFLMGVATVASYLPARRAMQVDPMVALRYE